MIPLASALGDAAQVGLALAVIFACMLAFVARSFGPNRVTLEEANDVADRLELATLRYPRVVIVPEATPDPPPPAIVLPPERHTRPAIVPDMDFDWSTASPEERAEAVLAVLPYHADDDNGITAKSVAHRLGLDKPQRVGNALTTLRMRGLATSRWQRKDGRRVYWRATAK